MSKRKYKKGIESIQKQIDIHKNVKNLQFLSMLGNRFAIYRHIKLEKALEEDNVELAQYYEKEIKRLEGQLLEKQEKLLPRGKRLKLKK